MNLNCPVCDRPNIETDICPNCETNLWAIRVLAELPSAQEKIAQKLLSVVWLPTVDKIRYILILVVGIILGSVGYFWFSHLLPPTATDANIVTTNNQQKQSQVLATDGFRYTVRSGDTLSLIAMRFYGDKDLWPSIVKANPYLKDRENYLEVGDVVIVPNLQVDSGNK